ncbi:MAG: tetratricopeptide repeat protein, partial [Deltaproteobacteria bacterium]|nr:tetratricopeptide repeat protein [Deltaproteobacteria bacterium]
MQKMILKLTMFKMIVVLIIGFLILGTSSSVSRAEKHQKVSREDIDEWMKNAGQLYAEEKYAEAIQLYRQAADHGNVWGQNNLAWIYATFKDPKYRNGKLAVHYALKATAQESKNSHFSRTLAAAYARDGQFDNAIETQEKAIELFAEDKTFTGEAREKLRQDNQEKL